MSGRHETAGITLLELLVVLVLLALGAALAAPLVVTRGAPATPPLDAALHAARANAVRRAETLSLTISTTGHWRLDAATDTTAPLATGAAPGYSGPALTVVVSPLGTCGLHATAVAAGDRLPVDPLDCSLVRP